MKIQDITTNAPASIANVTITPGADKSIAILESNDPMALAAAVCVAISNGAKFVSGTPTMATLERVA